MSDRAVITGVVATVVERSGTQPFRISEGSTKVHYSVLVRILTSEPGLEGLGEIVSAPPGKPEEIHEEIVAAVRRFAGPAIVGLPVLDRTEARRRIDAALKGRHWTKAGLDNALHDLAGKVLGIPVYDLLGGKVRDFVPVIGPVIGVGRPDEMAATAAALAAEGFSAIKIKVGETIAADIDRVRAVREAVGSGIAVRVDANDHYSAAEAIRLIRRIEQYEPEHVEQPVGRYDFLGMAAVQQGVGVPIMTDDTVATPADAVTILRLGAAQRVKVKVTKHGLAGARTIVGMLEAGGVGVVLGHVFEMGLAAAAEAQFALATPGLIQPSEIGSLRPIGITRDLIAEDLFPKVGELHVPARPGLGVTLEPTALELREVAA